jgi:hypothetical protein
MTPSYNSCRNRHCPKCQSIEQAEWIAARKERTLPVHHFHVVFTLPAELRRIAKANPRVIYTMLFRAAGNTLVELGETRLGATVGVTAVLHTWTRDLSYHPHVHCIVTGGGLALDEGRWIATSKRYLFPVKVLSRLFRGKFLNALRAAFRSGDIRGTSPDDFAVIVNKLYRTDWVVYAKRPFGSVEHVFQYLGRYTHRVGLSNQRLQSIDERGVRFLTRDSKSVTLPPREFIRRFLQHVLPFNFVKIRHYGLLAASHVETKLATAARLLSPQSTTPGARPLEPASSEVHATAWQDILRLLTGIDVKVCRYCGSTRLEKRPLSELDTG